MLGRRVKAVRQEFRPQLEEMRRKHRKNRQGLHDEQNKLFARIVTAIDITGHTKSVRAKAWETIKSHHRAERENLFRNFRTARKDMATEIKQEYQKPIDQINKKKFAELGMLSKNHQMAAANDDDLRQQREAKRVRESEKLDRAITVIKREAKTEKTRQLRL